MIKMELYQNSFQKILSGKKTIEMRLNDEKRSYIRTGDLVQFNCSELKQQMLCKVVNIYKYKSFVELYSNHNKELLGYEEAEEAKPSDMNEFYLIEEIEKHGVIGIELKFLNSFKV